MLIDHGEAVDPTMTHYQVLGVRSDADHATIRAAYLRLIKQHHPDRPGSADTDKVSRINVAYSVLRDPGRRAAYDMELRNARAQQVRTGSWAPRRRPAYSLFPDRSRSHLVWGLIVLACFAAFVPGDTLATTEGKDARSLEAQRLAAILAASGGADHDGHKQPELDPGIHSRVETASYATLAEANGVSRRCFVRLRDRPALSTADRCIAFDLAFAYWYDGEFRGWPNEEYFLATTMARRHQRALERLAIHDPSRRIDAIRGQTFSSIMDILTARREAVADMALKEGLAISPQATSRNPIRKEYNH